MQEEQILCACSAYEQKYYLNPRYASLPSAIQDELQIMAVTVTRFLKSRYICDSKMCSNIVCLGSQ